MAHDIRTFGRGLLLLADVLAALAAAGFVVVAYVAPGTVGEHTPAKDGVILRLQDNPGFDVVFAIALVLLAANALYYLYGRRPQRPLEYVTSEGAGGSVKVSRDALETALRTAGERLDVVSRLRVHVEHGPLKRVAVRAYFQAPEGIQILQASQALRAALVARYAEMVRASDSTRTEFDIEFTGFYGKAPPGVAVDLDDAADEAAPFTGPRYPIIEDDVASKER